MHLWIMFLKNSVSVWIQMIRAKIPTLGSLNIDFFFTFCVIIGQAKYCTIVNSYVHKYFFSYTDDSLQYSIV